MTQLQKVIKVIKTNHHMTIATINNQNKPWVTPVFYVHDDKLNLYWVSYKESIHSKNIRIDENISIVIYGPIPPKNNIDAVYIEATAKQLDEENEILPIIDLLSIQIKEAKYMLSSPTDVMTNAAWRIYKATPHTLSRRTENGEYINGQYITTREIVDINK